MCGLILVREKKQTIYIHIQQIPKNCKLGERDNNEL